MKSTGSRCSFRCSSAAKIFHLILFGIILPAACIVIPVYAKYVLYADTVVAFGASDMRMMDKYVSTTWCQVRNEKEKQRLCSGIDYNPSFYDIRGKMFK